MVTEQRAAQARSFLVDNPTRWVTVNVRLQAPPHQGLFGVKATRWAFTYLDSGAMELAIESWESGLLSGVLFVTGSLKQDPSTFPLVVESVEGSVCSDDVIGVAVAASAAAWQLLGNADEAEPTGPPGSDHGWVIQKRSL